MLISSGGTQKLDEQVFHSLIHRIHENRNEIYNYFGYTINDFWNKGNYHQILQVFKKNELNIYFVLLTFYNFLFQLMILITLLDDNYEFKFPAGSDKNWTFRIDTRKPKKQKIFDKEFKFTQYYNFNIAKYASKSIDKILRTFHPNDKFLGLVEKELFLKLNVEYSKWIDTDFVSVNVNFGIKLTDYEHSIKLSVFQNANESISLQQTLFPETKHEKIIFLINIFPRKNINLPDLLKIYNYIE